MKSTIAKTYDEIGKMFLRTKEYESAKDYFDQAIEMAPDDKTRARSIHNLSSIYFFLGDFLTQEALLKQSLELREGPNRFISLMDLGECYIKQNRPEEALIVLQEAHNYYPQQKKSSENIKLFEWLTLVSPDSLNYYRQTITQFKELTGEKKQLEALYKQQAMKNLLMRLESEK
ncbi:MAG: tetratricopeptide repeat protein, partial [Myxococcota bacterium]